MLVVGLTLVERIIRDYVDELVISSLVYVQCWGKIKQLHTEFKFLFNCVFFPA